MTSSDYIPVSNNDSSSVNDHDNIDNQHASAYAMTKVCFTMCILATVCHLLIASFLPRLRLLYGLHLLTTLYLMLTAFVLTLISCSLLGKHRLLVHITHFTYLSSISWTVVTAGYNWIVVYRGCHSDHTYRFCRLGHFLVASIFGFGLPALCATGSHFLEKYLRLENSTYIYPVTHIVDGIDQEYEVVACGLCSPSPIVIYLFFIPMLALIGVLAGLILTMVQMSHGIREDRHLMSQGCEVSARFWMTVKLCVSNIVIWTSALLSLILRIVAVWHIFTLSAALQAIYIAVNFTFSRPVLDLIYQCHEKEEDSKADQAAMYRSLQQEVPNNRTSSVSAV